MKINKFIIPILISVVGLIAIVIVINLLNNGDNKPMDDVNYKFVLVILFVLIVFSFSSQEKRKKNGEGEPANRITDSNIQKSGERNAPAFSQHSSSSNNIGEEINDKSAYAIVDSIHDTIASISFSQENETTSDSEVKSFSTILVVDDELGIRSSVKLVLEGEGYKVIEAENGYHALLLLSKIDVDLFFIDIKMPVLNGIETLNILKKRLPNLPVVMMSGHAEIETAVEAIHLGAIDFISKPFNVTVLLNSVKKAFSQKGEVSVTIKPERNDGMIFLKEERFKKLFIEIVELFSEYMKIKKEIEVKIVLKKIIIDFDIHKIQGDGNPIEISKLIEETLGEFEKKVIKDNFRQSIDKEFKNARVENYVDSGVFNNLLQEMLEIKRHVKELKGLEASDRDYQHTNLNVSGFKAELKNLVAEDRHLNVILKLVESKLETDIENQLIVLQSQLTQLIKDRGMKMIAYEVFNEKKNQISYALLNIIDDIDSF